MMSNYREIMTHKIDGHEDGLRVFALDAPGSGGAHHHYMIGRSVGTGDGDEDDILCDVEFQNGPIPENGVNGVTQETLLSIVADRLQCFQAGPFACAENGEALAHVLAAVQSLQKRTKDRLARQVEGKLIA